MKTIEQIAEILRKAASVVLISATFSVNGVTILYADKMPADAAPAVLPGTVEDTDEDWTWTGMQPVNDPASRNGSVSAGKAGTSGVYVFMGTGVIVYGIQATSITADGGAQKLGKLTVLIDGKQKEVVDLTSAPTHADGQIFKISGLKSANHVLQIKVTEGWGAVDSIRVMTRDEDAGTATAPPKVTIKSAIYGVPGDQSRSRNVRDKLQALVDARNYNFQVAYLAEGDDPAFGVVKSVWLTYTIDGKEYSRSGKDPDIIAFSEALSSDAGISTEDGGKDYRISPRSASSKWLDCEGNAFTDNSALSINGGPRPSHSQIWHVSSLGHGKFRISPKEKPDEAVTLLARTLGGAALCGLYAYTEHASQQWEIAPSGEGYFVIRNALDHNSMTVNANSTNEGAPIVTSTPKYEDNCRWRFVPVP